MKRRKKGKKKEKRFVKITLKKKTPLMTMTTMTLTIALVSVYAAGQEDTESETLAETEDISCGKPAAPEHGQVEGSDHSMGATIHYVCDDGYTLFGPDHAACLPVPDPFHHVAIWEPPNVPTCKGESSEIGSIVALSVTVVRIPVINTQRELINAGQTSHKYSNKDMSYLR